MNKLYDFLIFYLRLWLNILANSSFKITETITIILVDISVYLYYALLIRNRLIYDIDANIFSNNITDVTSWLKHFKAKVPT